MKKFFSLIGLLAISLFLIIYCRYRVYTTVELNGYAITSNNVAKNLYNNQLQDKDKKIDFVKVEEYENIYKRVGRLYVGEKKKYLLNESYPIFSKDSSKIVNINEDSMLIDQNFNTFDGYNGFIISSGNLYDRNTSEKIDSNTYILLKVEEGIYINTEPIKVKYNQDKEISIKMNSIIYFKEHTIRCYTLEKNTFVFHEFDGIDGINEITLGNKKINYENLLEKLEISVAEEKKEMFEENKPLTTKTTTQGEKEEIEIEQIEENISYVKPEISFEEKDINVYSVNGTLKSNDPSGVVTKNPTFTIYSKNNIYLRKSFAIQDGIIEISGLLPNTEFRIVGTYTYKNEKGKLIEKTFYEKEIKTKDINSLNAIELSTKIENIYSNKIEFTNIKLNNKTDDEVLKGIKKVVIKIDDDEYTLTLNQANQLKKLEEVTYETPEQLDSNKTYNYEFIIYDIASNKLKVDNSKASAKTSKSRPKVGIETEASDLTILNFKIKLNNKDNVNVSNLRYILYDLDNKIVSSGNVPDDSKLTINDLDANQIYQINVYADYDLEDGRGNIIGDLLATSKSSTNPITTLGYVRIKLEEDVITKDNASFNLALNNKSTDPKLLELLETIKISVLDEDKNVVKTKTINEKELEKLKQDEMINFRFENLYSNTKYTFDIKSIIKQGNKEYTFDVLNSLKTFATYKKDAEVLIINKYSNENLIDFDVRIKDVDGAIRSDRVLLQVRTSSGKLVEIKDIDINKDYKQITLEKLDKEETYVFTYIAEDYNVGTNNLTYEESKVLLVDNIRTEIGIYGSIELASLVKLKQSKNLFDLSNKNKWTSGNATGTSTIRQEYDLDNNILYLGNNSATMNNQAIYYYYLPEYKNRDITISFDYKYKKNSGLALLLVGNSSTRKTANTITDSYQKFSYTTKVSATGYIEFRIQVKEINKDIFVAIKNLQIELGKTATSYEKYKESSFYESSVKINLYDKKDEINDNSYYILTYKNNELENEKKYDMSSKPLEEHNLSFNLSANHTYRVELCVKLRSRYYKISEFSVNTNSEVYGISRPEDISTMHPYANYIVTKDLSFTDNTFTYSGTYYGTLDFQGHRVDVSTYIVSSKKSRTYVINNLGYSGEVKNFDLHIYNNAKTTNFKFIYSCNGNINNFMGTLEESVNVANYNFTLITGNVSKNAKVSNFVINLKVPFYCQNNSALVSQTVYGIVSDGYVYGEPLNAIYASTDSRSKHVGAIATQSYIGGVIESVYSLIDVNTNESNGYSNIVANLNGALSASTLKNSYSVGDGENRDFSKEINYGPSDDGGQTSGNLYYVSDNIYKGTSIKISKQTLANVIFQNKVLNTKKQFIIDEIVNKGFYPHVKLNNELPKQEYIELPKSDTSDLPDVSTVTLLDSTDNSATLKVDVFNPSQEKVTNINIQYLNTKITNIKYDEEMTYLTVEVSNPSKYLSYYYVNSITFTSAYDISYTRTYEANEKKFNITLYRTVSNITEFKNIAKYPSENYKLIEDIDFNDTEVFFTSSITYINGNNHKISNIKNNNKTLFNYIGTIIDLNIENYTMTGSYNGNAGIFVRATNINNVHANNVTISTNASNYASGFVSYLDYGFINNSSVSNVKLTLTNSTNTTYVGGLVGYTNYSSIDNSYVQNVEIDVTNALSVTSLGGLLGYAKTTTEIKNVYVTGKISTNFSYVGGIIGSGNSTIGNCYSYVDIYSTNDYVGGIAGSISSGTSSVYNSLSIGNIYTSFVTSDLVKNNISRTVGNNYYARYNNYVWERQLYNGSANQILKGEVILSTSNLKNPLTWNGGLKFYDVYDYSDVDKGVLPKMKNSITGEVMPYQENIYLEEPQFEVSNVKIANKQVSSATIAFTINNPNEYEILYIEIEGLTTTSKLNEISYTEEGKTYIYNMNVIAEKYFDSYKIDRIYYKDNAGNSVSYDCAYKLDLTFYKRISNFEDFQNMDDTYQNYILVSDIDFSGKTNINYNIYYNRLEGELKKDGSNYSLKNLTLNFDTPNSSLFKSTILNTSNIDFENITITNTSSSGAFTGIFGINNGNLDNVNFKNITINAEKLSNVGVISKNTSSGVKNLNFESIFISGTSSLAALSGTNLGTIKNITMNDIEVHGNGIYVGGVLGYNSGTISSVTANGISIENLSKSNYTGGIVGYGNVSSIKAYDVILQSNSNYYTGGIVGYGNVSSSYLYNSKINSIGDYVGGITGSTYATTSFVINSSIKGKNYVGGINGYNNWDSNISKSGIINTSVESTGSNVGGISGRCNVVTNSFVFNSNIKANGNYAGGIYGEYKAAYYDINSQNNYVNANIIANGSGAGGLIGHLSNSSTTTTTNRNRAKYNLIENSTITANSNVGGLIGYADKAVLSDTYGYSLIVANLITTSENGNINNIIGNNEEYANLFINTYVYEDSKINNESAALKEDDNVTYVGRDEMLDTNFYTNNLKITTTNWDFSNVAKGYFPKLAGLSNQLDIEIPNWSDDEENTSIMLFSSPRMLSRSYSLAKLNNVHKLPDIYVYSSGPDRINIEFSEVDNLSSFKIGNNIYNIDKKTYTFAYNYNEDIKLEITDGINTFYKTFKLNDIKHNIGTYDLYYYYLDNNYLKGNIDSVKGKFNHIYEKYALRNDGSVYDIAKKNFIGKASNNYTLLDTVPLYTFNYNGKNIKTYYTYSSLDNEYVDKQIFVKNNVMDMVSSVLDNNKISVIMDNYNDNNYLTVLGNDGILYDLKSSVKLPNDMNRKNIKYMTSNIKNNSSIILVEYNSGSVYGFDYRTGKLLFSKKKNEDINIFDYFRQELNVDNSPSISNDVKKEYTSSSALIDKINTKEENAQTNYIRVYDPLKNKYVLYDNDNLTSNLSFNDKIDKSAKLSEYYYDDTMGEIIRKNISGIGILVAILSLIIASYILWTKFINKTEKKDSEV